MDAIVARKEGSPRLRSTTIVAAITALLATTSATAQMRVAGQRPADPRLQGRAAPAPTPSPTATVDGPVPAPATAQGQSPAAGPLQRPSFLGGAQSSAASGPSALDLMKQCFDGSIDGGVVNPTCVGYMAGAIGALRMAAQADEDFPICLPEDGLTNESVVSDMSSYLEANGDALQRSARSVLFLVLSKRHPCTRRK